MSDAKQTALTMVCAQLEQELLSLQVAVDSATAAATHAENKAENKYDTRGLEASYLAGAQAERAAELRSAIARLRASALPNGGDDAPVTAMTLVEVFSDEVRSHYLVLPVAGGYSVEVGGVTIKTLTSQTPLGRAMMGKRAGDAFTVEMAQGAKEYEIMGVN